MIIEDLRNGCKGGRKKFTKFKKYGRKARKTLTNGRIRLYNGKCINQKKAVTKTVGTNGNFQRAGAGESPVRVQGFEYHFRASD